MKRSLSDTIARLARLRGGLHAIPTKGNRLSALTSFGSNPGALQAKYYIPSNLKARTALVVVLHGCTQNAAGYDIGSGWSQLADEYGFAVLFPEQTRANNANLCFNWFVPQDTRRDSGEALSIRQMIDAVASMIDIDRKQIFITGLSAGGAMANAMLVLYPEVFAGGAIIAGLPFGSATTIPEAFDRMRGHGMPTSTELQSRLRAASPHGGAWPTVSIWQGTADNTVVPANADALVEQWRAVHDVDSMPTSVETVDGHLRKTWKDSQGLDLIEVWSISGMGHGTPLDAGDGYGRVGPYMLDEGISSTRHIARSWGITPSFSKEGRETRQEVTGVAALDDSNLRSGEVRPQGIQKVIEDALRSAGLMR